MIRALFFASLLVLLSSCVSQPPSAKSSNAFVIKGMEAGAPYSPLAGISCHPGADKVGLLCACNENNCPENFKSLANSPVRSFEIWVASDDKIEGFTFRLNDDCGSVMGVIMRHFATPPSLGDGQYGWVYGPNGTGLQISEYHSATGAAMCYLSVASNPVSQTKRALHDQTENRKLDSDF
jgi:hypothetical protein